MKRVILTVVMLFLPCFVFGQILSGVEGEASEIRLVDSYCDIGVRALGMGGTHIAVAEDYTAGFYNPARLGYLKALSVGGTFSYENTDNTTTYYGTESSRSKGKLALNSFGGVVPLPAERGGAAFGISINRIASFDRVFRICGTDADGVDKDGLEVTGGGLDAFNLSGGIQVAPGVSMGMAVDFWTGAESYTWTMVEAFPSGDSIIFDDNIKYEYSGLGAKFGMTFIPWKFLELGTVINFPITLTVAEDGTQRTDSLTDTLEVYTETSGISEEYKYSLPYTLGAGAAFRLSFVTLAADVYWTDWTQLEYKSPDWILYENRYIPDSYRSVVSLHFGAEATLPLNIRLRAGYFTDPIPYTVRKIENDRDYLTFGGSVLIANQLTIDAAYNTGYFSRKDRHIELTEAYDKQMLFLGMGYRF